MKIENQPLRSVCLEIEKKEGNGAIELIVNGLEFSGQSFPIHTWAP